MSIKTFFEKVGAELKKLFTSTTVEQQIQSTITYAAPLVEGILALVDPAVVPLISGIISTVKSDLATVSTVVQGSTLATGSSALATVKAAISSVNTNLASILDLAEVKNSTKAADVTATITTLTGEF